MKVLQISVERNFHIMNDDRFIMEKISMSADLMQGEDEQVALNNLRDKIVTNFKAAYPHLRTCINFDEVIQVKDKYPKIENDGFATTVTQENGDYQSTVNKSIHFGKINDEKINKGTIGQSDFYTQEDAVENIKKEITNIKFKGVLEKVYAPMIKNYPQLQDLYNEKLKELQEK